MTAQLAAKALLLGSFVVVGSISSHAQSWARYLPAAAPPSYQISTGGTAVDVKGVRHAAREYPGDRAPWNFVDRTKAFAPEYEFHDKVRRLQGSGFFAVFVDPSTGVPTRVSIIKSTGHASLDRSAIDALQRWRWKPGKWSEVDVPVTFQLGGSRIPPPGAIHLSR